jgi:hypothetical protein
MGRGHAAEPDEHRRGTGAEEVDQQIRGLPSRRAGRPPVSGHVHRRGPVGGSGDHCRAEAVADRPVIRRARRRLRCGGGEIEPGAQPPQNVGVEGVGPGEQLAARGDVVSGRGLPVTGQPGGGNSRVGTPGARINPGRRIFACSCAFLPGVGPCAAVWRTSMSKLGWREHKATCRCPTDGCSGTLRQGASHVKHD